jgi:hypothetical protein
MVDRKKKENHANRRNFHWLYVPLFFILVVILIGLVARPGVFTIQSNQVFPDGITIVYYSKDYSVPFFSSPDAICLKVQGYVSPLCQMSALVASRKIADRILFRLPYSHWAYLQSTGGMDFDK